jgi:hypothetical protein
LQDNTILIIVSGVLTFGGTIVTSLLSVYRENAKAKSDKERHEWERQDRIDHAAAIALALQQQAAAVEDKMKGTADALAKTSQAATGVILTKIQENTDISTAAFDAANHVDEKLSAVHKRIDGVQDTGQQDRIEQTGNDTNATVHKIEKEG